MPRIQLTIKTTYLPSWGAWEGIREVIQNGRDAEFEHQSPMVVDWYNDTLRVENEGVTLPLKALLLGHTTKTGRSDTIGKFGEGLKLGILALVRAGHPVKIRNGSEVWTPTIERSDTFDDDVLTFTVESGRQEKARVRVEIGGVTKEDWDLMKENFLFVKPPKKNEAVVTTEGTLLRGPKYQGRIYVKGIFVQSNPELTFGYDFSDAELDRDRKMIESWNLKYKVRAILLKAVSKEPTLRSTFREMLEGDATFEVQDLDHYYMDQDLAKSVAAEFQTKHGKDAIPVTSLAESADIEHLGKKGVVVSKPLATVLANVLGSTNTVKEELRKEVLHKYSWHELSPEERTSLTEAVSLINAVESFTLDTIDVVDFRSEDLMGQYKEERICIARKYLQDPNETLRILVHEKAHEDGADGDKGHVWRMELIWKGIVANLRKG
jgi:hypothetical protein